MKLNIASSIILSTTISTTFTSYNANAFSPSLLNQHNTHHYFHHHHQQQQQQPTCSSLQPYSSSTLYTTSNPLVEDGEDGTSSNTSSSSSSSSSNNNKKALKDELREKSSFVDLQPSSSTTLSTKDKNNNEEALKSELRQKSTFVNPVDEIAYGGVSSSTAAAAASDDDIDIEAMTEAETEANTEVDTEIQSQNQTEVDTEMKTQEIVEGKELVMGSDLDAVVEDGQDDVDADADATIVFEEADKEDEEVVADQQAEMEDIATAVDDKKESEAKSESESKSEPNVTIDDEISALVDEVNKLTNEVSEEIKEVKSKLKMKEEEEVEEVQEANLEEVMEEMAEEKVELVVEQETATTIEAEVNAVEASKVEDDKTTPEIITSVDSKRLERILKPRPYPLFLAEKAALLSGEFYKSLTGNGGSNKYKDVSPIEKYRQKIYGVKKEKIVILGTGWGSAAFLKDIDTNMFDVTVISPRNYFLFTPMLAGASVGTVDYRSITESVREINRRVKYLEGTAMEIDPESKNIVCESVVCEGNSCSIEEFNVTYDKLIVTVGAQTNTYGIPGVREYCCFLKQVEDAKRVRTAIVNCFERANLPNLNEEQKKAVLTFAVIGAGPTGVEFASELRDFIEQDGPKYYPDLLKYVRIKVIEASPTVLAPFDKSLQEEAIKQLTRVVQTSDPETLELLPDKFKLTELLLNSGVSEVKEDKILLNDDTEIPYGLAVWAAGNGPLPITLQLIDSLGKDGFQGEAQSIARGRLAVDAWMRVLDGDGDIFSFGDCSCITSGQLPATAQVASQQGEYLARLFSLGCDMYPGVDSEDKSMLPPLYDSTKEKKLAEKISSFAINEDNIAAPFQFLNLGILAYTGGGSALAQLQLSPAEQARVKGRGKIGFSLWRSVYLSKQVSWRNRCLVTLDWVKTQIFGRDITTFD